MTHTATTSDHWQDVVSLVRFGYKYRNKILVEHDASEKTFRFGLGLPNEVFLEPAPSKTVKKLLQMLKNPPEEGGSVTIEEAKTLRCSYLAESDYFALHFIFTSYTGTGPAEAAIRLNHLDKLIDYIEMRLAVEADLAGGPGLPQFGL